MDIAELLAFSVKHNASDLHLSAGLPPMIRVDGDIRRINVPVLEHKVVHGLVYDIMNDKQRKDFEEFWETDFSFEIPGLARFRGNPGWRGQHEPLQLPGRRGCLADPTASAGHAEREQLQARVLDRGQSRPRGLDDRLAFTPHLRWHEHRPQLHPLGDRHGRVAG